MNLTYVLSGVGAALLGLSFSTVGAECATKITDTKSYKFRLKFENDGDNFLRAKGGKLDVGGKASSLYLWYVNGYYTIGTQPNKDGLKLTKKGNGEIVALEKWNQSKAQLWCPLQGPEYYITNEAGGCLALAPDNTTLMAGPCSSMGDAQYRWFLE